MSGLIARAVGGRSAAAIVAAFALVPIAGCAAGSHAARSSSVDATATSGAPVRALQANPTRLAAAIDRTQAVIDDPSSTPRELAHAGLLEELATGALERETPQTRRATMALLGARAAASMHADLSAEAALSAIVPARAGLPHWRIVQPPSPDTLLGYFRAAEARFGVPWEDLAAIELIETRFGRIEGLSPAGARGPMQFMPATWARYGTGRVDNQRDAILGAARYLRANGAPGDMAGALYRYNNSRSYVRAVEEYARRMRTDFRAYYGYYYWQVLYARAGGTVMLPIGYPKARPVPLALLKPRTPAG